MRCEAGWTRSLANGTKTIICLLDREPVLTNMARCDRYELRAREWGHRSHKPTLRHRVKPRLKRATSIPSSQAGAYFNRLIAAARSTLSRADAAAGIRSLRTQKILAMRAAKDRRRAASANQPRRVHPGPTTPRSNQQFG